MGKFQLAVNAADAQTGVSHIEFWWHSPDWQSSDWKFIGQDLDGTDGWSVEFDTSNLDIKTSIAIYARVFDKAGNSTGVGSYNLNSTDHLLSYNCQVRSTNASLGFSVVKVIDSVQNSTLGISLKTDNLQG